MFSEHYHRLAGRDAHHNVDQTARSGSGTSDHATLAHGYCNQEWDEILSEI